jgi:uncharacterized protein
MIIQRLLLPLIEKAITPGKVLILYGPRQVGKTTLVTELIARSRLKCIFINADELIYRQALASQDKRILGGLLGENELLVIDEAQRVPDIGLNLKIIIDNNPHAAIVATGSASFDLANKISEPLTGRKFTYDLYPLSYGELVTAFGEFEAHSQLERWLVYGGYPAILTTEVPAMRERLLSELAGAYLYKDILELDGVRRADKIIDLLRLLAFQIGHEVSINELAMNLAINRDTVGRYLDLLEKVFVIFRISGYSRNLRKEITKNARYYFYDNGVRNVLIQNFNPLTLRNDIGQLWENYLMVERRKINQYTQRRVNSYFWRTYDQKEIDYIEEGGGKISGFEFKWQGEMKESTKREFIRSYPESELMTITRQNFDKFLE